MGVNLLRLVLCGLVTGLVINLGELAVNVWLLGDAWSSALRGYGFTVSFPELVYWGVGSFVLGIVGVWIYVAIRPRYSPGAAAALRAGLALWAVTYLYVGIGMAGTTGVPRWLLFVSVAWGLVEMGAAVYVGAWLYREGELIPGGDAGK